MTADSEAQFIISADNAKFNASMDATGRKAQEVNDQINASFREMSRKVSGQVQEVQEKVNKSFEHMNSAVELFKRAALAVGAVLAGGEMFKEVIDETVKWTSEAVRLSKTLGITTEEASALNVALDDLNATALGYNVSADTMEKAVAKLTQRLAMNEKAFHEAGVATRDSNGHLRSTMDIMGDVNSYLANLKAGTDRNTESARLYGKSWVEVQGILGLTTERMVEGRKRAEELHLLVGPDGEAKVQQYKAAMNDLDDSLLSVKVQIGDALLPVLSKLGSFMGEEGPAMGDAFKRILQGIGFTAAATWLTLKDMGQGIGAIAAQAVALAHGDVAAFRFIGAERDIQAKKNEDEFNRLKKSIFSDAPAAAAGSAPDGAGAGNHAKDHTAPKAAKSRVGEWDAQLTAQKDAYAQQKLEQGSFEEYSKESERNYWKHILDTVKLTHEERIAVQQKYFSLEKDLRKQQFDAEIEEIKAKSAAYKQGSVERIQIAGDVAVKMGEKYGIESKEYKTALADMEAMARARAAQQRQLDDMAIERTRTHNQSMLALEQERLSAAHDLGNVSDLKYVQALQVLKEKEYQIELQAMQDKAALLDADSVEYQQYLDKLAALKQKHELAMAQLGSQAVAAQAKETSKLFDPITNAFQKSIDGMIQGTQTFQQGMRKMMQSIVLEFANTGVQMVIDSVKTEYEKTQAATVGAAARAAVEKGAAAKSAVVSADAGLKEIMISAWKAMAGAYAAIAAIPYVGPFLAPVVAAGTFAAVAGLASNVMSAEGGYDIPAGMNPMTQLHQREMVLPAKYADVVRGMADGGGSGGGGQTLHYHDHSGRLSASEIQRNAATIVKVLKGEARNFAFVP